MTWLIGFLTKNWRIVLLATVIASQAGWIKIQSTRLSNAKDETRQLMDKIRSAEDAASQARQTFNQTLARIERDHKTVVEQAKKGAVAAYAARYGSGNAAGGVRFDGVRINLPTAGSDAAERAEAPHGSAEERLAPPAAGFVQDCAVDSATILEWQRWATMNGLKAAD